MNRFKIALIQNFWELGQVEKNVRKAEQKIREAHANGADFICLPEGFNTGYYCYDYETMKAAAEPLDGPTIRRMQALAGELGVHLMAPVMQTAGTGIVENTAVLIDDEGQILGHYSKSHLVGNEQLHLSRGKSFPVFQTKYGKVGIVICYDICFPETTRILALAGADLILCPSASGELHRRASGFAVLRLQPGHFSHRGGAWPVPAGRRKNIIPGDRHGSRPRDADG